MGKNRVAALGLLLILLITVAVAALYLRQRSLPVYTVGVLPPSNGYATNTLSLGLVTYVSGKSEFRLRPIDQPFTPPWSAIGQTEGGAWRIYRPPGSSADDYIYVTGDMMPQVVYRSSRLAPLELGALRVSEIRAFGGAAVPAKKSNDEALIREVMNSLTAGEKVRLDPNDEAGDRSLGVDLLPEQMPGLYYRVDGFLDKGGKAYLSTETELGQDTWIPAGPSFTRWVTGH